MNEKEMKREDWHPADIKAELEKKGLNMAELSRSVGLAESTLRNVFRSKYPKAQRIVAAALGVPAKTIWPSRY